MKKDKRKHAKAARKAIRKDIKLGLVAKLKEVIGSLGQSSKKLEKVIEKASEKLATQISKKLKIVQSSNIEEGEWQKSAPEQLKSENIATQDLPSLDSFTSRKRRPIVKTTKIVEQEA